MSQFELLLKELEGKKSGKQNEQKRVDQILKQRRSADSRDIGWVFSQSRKRHGVRFAS